MTNSEFIKQVKYVIESYINSDIKIDLLTNELLTEEDFILLLNKILSNYVERNFNRTRKGASETDSA